jgi:hypothetical protein
MEIQRWEFSPLRKFCLREEDEKVNKTLPYFHEMLIVL